VKELSNILCGVNFVKSFSDGKRCIGPNLSPGLPMQRVRVPSNAAFLFSGVFHKCTKNILCRSSEFK
jgi:hypothetical protein